MRVPRVSAALFLAVVFYFGMTNLVSARDSEFGTDGGLQKTSLEIKLKAGDEGLECEIKNASPLTLVLFKPAREKIDLLLFVKINGERVTSGAKVQISVDDDLSRERPGLSPLDQISELRKNAAYVVLEPGQSMTIPIGGGFFKSADLLKVENAISESNPLDVTVAFIDLIAGLVEKETQVIPVKSQPVWFSNFVEIDRLPAM